VTPANEEKLGMSILRNLQRLRRCISPCIAAGLYVSSFFLPGGSLKILENAETETTFSGLHLFCVGLGGLLDFRPSEGTWWTFFAGWLANPLIWVAWVASIRGRFRTCRIAAATAIVLTLPALISDVAHISQYPAYWVWIGSALVLFAQRLIRSARH
jgi:hypothetical protein